MNDKNNKTKPRIGRSIFLLTVLFRPKAVFEDLAVSEPSPYRVFFKFLIWFAMLPPLFAYIGGSWKGWDLGAENPLVLGETELRAVSAIFDIASKWLRLNLPTNGNLFIQPSLLGKRTAPKNVMIPKNNNALARINKTPSTERDAVPVAIGTMMATSASEAISSSTADVMMPVAAGVLSNPSDLSETIVSDTAVAVIANPHRSAMLCSPQKYRLALYAIIKGTSAPKNAIPQLRFTLFRKLPVSSSKPSANIMTMIPSSAKSSIKTGISIGSQPIFTIIAPKNRYQSAGVNLVLSARYAAANTLTQIRQRTDKSYMGHLRYLRARNCEELDDHSIVILTLLTVQ